MNNEFSWLTQRVGRLQTDLENLEDTMNGHKEEDQEYKLYMIEGMKRIGRVLGVDQEFVSEVEETFFDAGEAELAFEMHDYVG